MSVLGDLQGEAYLMALVVASGTKKWGDGSHATYLMALIIAGDTG